MLTGFNPAGGAIEDDDPIGGKDMPVEIGCGVDDLGGGGVDVVSGLESFYKCD